MLTTAERILESASRGEATNTPDRRHAVMYLMATAPDVTNTEMAEMFKVSERTIREDKKRIREDRSKRIKEEDVSLVIADILMDFERNVADIEKSKKVAKLGTKTYLDHCNGAMDMRLKTAKALQDLGFLPKSLGHLAVHKYNYQSLVPKGDAVETHMVESFDGVQDAAFEVEIKALPAVTELELGRAASLEEPDYLKDVDLEEEGSNVVATALAEPPSEAGPAEGT